MLSLFTGLPGTGKTLHLIKYLCEEKQYLDRPVYYYNIDIHHFDKMEETHPDYLDVDDFKKSKLAIYNRLKNWIEIDEAQMRKWYELPHGSIVICDEVQKLWRPRTAAKQIPQDVEELETSRHLGIDLFFTSQFPMQIDNGARNLVQYHKHLKRPGNLKSGSFKQYEECVDPKRPHVPPINNGVYSLDSNYYGLYKSAEVHTHGARIPKKLYFVAFTMIFFIAFSIWIVSYLTSDEPLFGRKVEPVESEPVQNNSNNYQTVAQSSEQNYYQKFITRLNELPFSAPIYDALISAASYPRISGCIQFSTKYMTTCSCTTQQGTSIELPEKICLTYIASGGQFDFSKEDENMDEYMTAYLPTGEPCCSSGSSNDDSTNESIDTQ